MNFAWDCFVADAPRNDIAIIFTVIASPDARDKLREAISDITISPRIAAPRDLRYLPHMPILLPMEINRLADMDITSLSTSACTNRVQSEAQVKLLKESMDFEKDMMAKLLQTMGIGQQIDTVA